MLRSIARALEERDQTLGHGARVAALAEPVAAALGWDRQRIRSLRFAAPLHDVDLSRFPNDHRKAERRPHQVVSPAIK